MSPWLQLLGSGGVAAIILATVNALANRRNLGAATVRTGAESEQITVATARGLVADMQQDLEAMRKRLTELENQRHTDKAHIETQATEIAGLKRRMEGVIQDRDDILRFVDVLRIWVASGAKPPPPAIPRHLADVLPAWMPADGAEPPPRKDDPSQ